MKILYELKKEHIPFLRKEYTKPVKNDEIRKRLLFEAERPLFAVGDITLLFLKKNKIPYNLGIFDLKTRRSELEKEKKDILNGSGDFITVRNPAGTITEELKKAILKGLKEKKDIFVEGEEDLAATCIFYLVKEGIIEKKGTLAYGSPGNGTIITSVKKVAEKLPELSMFR